MLAKLRLLLVVIVGVLVFCQANWVAAAVAPDTAQKLRLKWPPIADAVIYELIITDAAGWNKPDGSILTKTDIYTNGVELAATQIQSGFDSLWWQVRALNLDRQPISSFTAPRRLSQAEFDPAAPLPTACLDKRLFALLYPTYAWIPVLNAASYEVQVLAAPVYEEEAAADVIVKSYTIDSGMAFDCYDPAAYTQEGTWWWRVRAFDEENQPLGAWSKPKSFTVRRTGTLIAVLGDSVTHGGGAVSNPPSDPAYDWTSYTGLPIRNLGRSGDTTATMLSRFDSDVLPFAPKVLVVMGGVNDLRGGTAADAVIDNLAAIREKCRQNGIIPVFVTVTPVNPAAIQQVFNEETDSGWQQERQQVNQWIKSQRYYVDVAPLLTDSNGLLPAKLATDGLHPDTKGKAMIGQAIGEYLRQEFSEECAAT